ncbi:Gfo/Idh/MocA family protein [Paenibacillus agricola]|uniref:Gfo/Idh/MocA family oxidoreductase n=1 Tax=Paenibacillus agricola TaxID=2716264 RepID=A0ABX0J4M4_9BACL|nr:Gfo/Idh/MocA family oxidoreductase [Paenibacillus agricola]NHN29066.1 Gfo/Idh/MocA family oxidoreductase [Paenibacillus agricola]
MSNQTIKWGIAGPGNISKQFVKDLAFASGAEIVAVGGRNLEKAEAFAKMHHIAKAYGSLDELANDPDIDIVYLGTLHPAHKDNTLTFLRAGKAVLCEKPFTMNAAEAEEMVTYAKENRIFLMEAMWTRHLPAIHQVRQWLAEGKIGEVKLVKADFGFNIGWKPESRLLNRDLGGGTLLDAGIYPISFASMVYGAQPTNILSSVRMGETGVDEQFSLIFEYEGGQTAAINGSVQLAMTNEAYIFGSKGHIHIPLFLSARTATLRVTGEEPEVFQDERVAHGFVFEAEEAMACLRDGLTESTFMKLDETLAIMTTLDTIRKQWGLVYPAD